MSLMGSKHLKGFEGRGGLSKRTGKINSIFLGSRMFTLEGWKAREKMKL